MIKSKQANRLINEKSPYLLQHAYNPVDWYPWGDEAFEKAKEEDKPIFLSIGYSTCHWCHVMAKESFEDEQVAALLNRHYVSIKVDREERPDIDQIYMSACQVMAGQGGWPLTIIMTPDKKPFFSGTYFPKESRWGRSGLLDILEQINQLWKNNREHAEDISQKVVNIIQGEKQKTKGQIDEETVDEAFNELSTHFDERYGGIGNAPKFPMVHSLLFLLRYWKKTTNQRALEIVEKTLEGIYKGGIHDHIGGGFHRYSTDGKWLVPHFEKMLYDNALLAYTYLEACEATGIKLYAEIAKDIFTYILRDMTSPEGGFYSAEDADSEGVEGKFYIWSKSEIYDVLGHEVGDIFCQVYNISEDGDFEGANIPNMIQTSIDDIVKSQNISYSHLQEILKEARLKLLQERAKRVRPHKDQKILTSWNGLMVAAMAKGGRVLGDDSLTEAAKRALEFIESKLMEPDGRLLARYSMNEAAFPGYLDDYAFIVWGLLELYEATFDAKYLEKARDLNTKMIELFWDDENGGLFFYGKDGEQLIARPKEAYDSAIPSGNSVAQLNMLKLARLLSAPELEKKAAELFSNFASEVNRNPSSYCFLLIAHLFAAGPTKEIVITGDPESPKTKLILQKIRAFFLPDAVVIFNPSSEDGEEIRRFLPFLKEMRPPEGEEAAVYICENYACKSPVTNLNELVGMLGL